MDYFVVPEEDLAHLQFGPREAVFQKPSEKDNHLKALYMRGHINGKPVTHMLVDGGAIVDLMPYSYDLINCTKDGLVSAVLKPMDNRLNRLM